MSRHACLNRAYRLVWDAMRNLWIPVAETARRRGKSGRVLTLSATLALAAGTGWALPTGGVITAGEGQIGQSGQVMTISQGSSRLAVDWEGFSIDRNETVNFVQPDTGAIALNRVLGQDPSRILGGLNANGQVFVLNPNGVLFGQQAQVSVGGLVASTLGLATPDFLSGNFRFSGTSTQEVSNAGALQARDGGYIALLGARVSNSGTLEAYAGSVNLAAGQAVTLQLADGSLAGLTVDQGSLDALAANHGLIRADGGQVLLTAEGADRLARAVVNHDGVIEARTLENRNGVIRLMGDMEVGAVQVDGTLDASAPTSGNGGFVETSAATVRIGDDARITTLSATGVTGSWLIDPRDFLVSATGGDISGTSLSKELDLTSVVIQNTDGGVEGNGDIFINDLVAWSADTQLTLNAERNVQINDRIIADGKSAGLIIKPALGGEGRYSLGAGGSITLNGLNASLQISGTDFTLIRDINALQLLETKGGNYALATDIDASATAGWNRAAGFTPIGTASNPFDGILDGLGHTLTGLTINRPTESGIGLFAQSNGQIRYVHLDKAAISGASTTAALAGINNGAVVGSSVNGQVQVTTNPDITGMADIGGLVGLNNGVISQSSSAAEVRVKGDAAASNLSYIGGLAGRNTNLIMDSVSTGAVTVGLTDGGTVAAVGGLVGLNTGSIDDSTLVNVAPVTGGAVQVTASAPALSNFSADIQHVGGVVGQNDLSLTLHTDKNAYRGGAVTVINDKPDGAISNVGGIVGTNNGILSDALATVSVTVTGSGVSAVGGGVGLISKGAVTNVHAAGTVTVQSAGTRFLQNIGGLVGENDADLRNSSAAGVVKVVMDAGNASNIGGLVGYNRGTAAGTSAMIAPATTGGTPAGAVYDSLASAAVEVTSSEGSTINAVAGQVGTNSGVINLGGIITPYNGGAVTVSMFNTLTRNAGYIFNVGGLLGQSQGDVLLLGGGQLFSAGPVTVSHLAQGGFLSGLGGIVGFNSSSKGLFSHVSGTVQATIDNATGAMAYSVGGVAGTNSGTISDGRGMVLLADSAGGLLDNATYAGGLVGSNYGVISDSQATGSVTGSNYVGGLVGQNYTAGTIQRSFFYGDVAPSVKVVGASGYVGGLVGQNDGTIQTSYFNGSVRGFDGLSDLMGGGGIAGFNSASGKISNSYAVGTVTGGNVVGGLVGANAGAIINSYAATTVTGSSGVGGLVGQNIDGSVVVGSFYDLGQTPDDGTGYGMATTDLMKGETFSLAGWDIAGAGGSSAIWRIYEGQTLPLLRNFLTGLTISANNAVKEYDGTGYAGGNGLGFSQTPSSDLLYGSAVFSGDSQGARNVGTYGLDVSGFYSSQQGYDISYQSGSLRIDPKTLLINAVALDRVYDGTIAAGVNANLVGVVAGEDVFLTATGVFDTRHAGQGKTVYASYVLGGMDDVNYRITLSTDTLSASITPLDITGVITADSKVYDASLDAVTHGTVSGVLGTDDVSLLTSGTFDDANAGKGKTVSLSYALSGNEAGNYSVTANGETTADIDPRMISGVIRVDDKVYDGTTDAVTSGTLSGVLDSDSLGMDTSGYFLDKQVGSSKTVNVSYNLTGSSAGNYVVTANTEALASITPRTIYGLVTADSKVYDATTDAITYGWLDGVLGTDDVGLVSSGYFLDKNVGTDKLVVLSHTVTGLDAKNYDVQVNTETLSEITPMEISAQVIADSKVYDATTAAVTSGSLSGVLGSDELYIDATTGSFSDKHVGTGKTVTVGFTVAGADAGNYTVKANTEALADITPREISGLIVADSKVYDATTAAVTSGSLSGVLGSDELYIDATTGSFSDKHVGSSKTVTVGFTVAGADAGNYTVKANTEALADITPREISGLIVADSKVYDATTAAVTSGSLSGVLGSDELYIDATTGSFSDKHVGSSKTVTVGFTVAGADAGNYTVLANTATTANITPREISGLIVADSKVYDATTAAVTSGSLSGVLGSDELYIDATTGSFSDKHVGSSKTVTVGFTVAGADAGNYTVKANTEALADITPREISGLIVADSKVYDATTAAVTSGSLSGVLGSDELYIDATTGSFSDKHVGTGKTVTVGFTVAGADAGNYTVKANTATTANITPREISGLIVADSKVYDATTAAVTSGSLSGVLGSDELLIDSTTGVFSDKHVGTGKTVTVGFTVAGADAGNYTVLANTTTTANITPREISGLIVADSKVYDATTAAVTSGSLSGVLGSDELLIDSTTGVFSDKHVGTGKTVTVGFTVAGADAGNYTVLANTEALADITPREISGLIVADSKVYDATTAAVTSGSLSGVLGSDELLIDSTTGVFSDKHVGTGKTVTVGFTVAGADAGNYTVLANTEALADITPREISGLITADSKVYDATTAAVTSGSLSGVLGSDELLIDSTTGVFSDKHVGTGKTVTVGFTVAGADAGNYTVLANTEALADITPREISGLIVADSKVYDATTAAVTSGSLSGVLGSDELLIDSTMGVFSDKHVGSSKTVTVGFTVAGADAGNYTVKANTEALADITPREISGLIVADSKVYDATTAAVTSGSLSGVLGSDELYIDATTGSFSDKHVGSSKTVTVGFTVAGADAGNYTVLANTTTTANITPREISGLIVADSKVYDATTAAVTSGSLSGVLGSDELLIDSTTGVFSDKHVGTGKTVTVGFTVAGADAGNYTVLANTTTTANITPREISGLIVADSKVYDATTAAVTSGSLSGVLGSDELLIDSTTGVFSDKHVGTGKTVTVGFTVAGADAGNYTVLANTEALADITPREISGLIVADSKVYDATTAAVTSGSLSGVLGSDELLIDSTTGVFSDKHVGTGKTVTVGFTVAGADAGNYTVLANTEALADITPREISGLITADSKVYDATTAAVTSGSLSGVLGSDELLIDSTTGVFSDKHVGTGKTVTVGFTVAGADAGNYTVLANTEALADITPREISGLIVADSKVYDATTAAVTSGSLSGVLGSDELLIDSTTGVFSDKHVGSSKTVTVGFTVAGADAGNYTVLANTTTTANITPREISGLITADNKVYDATTAAVTSGSLSGVLGSDELLIDSTTGVFSDKHVGSSKTVTVGFTVAGADAGNYTVLANTTTTANITPREISGLITADNKVYDATTAAVTSGSLSGVLGSDELLIDSTTGVFSDKHVGSSKTVTVGFTVAGADAGNYTVLANTTTTANITPREISGLITADNKVYDATTAAVTSGSLSGVLGSDELLIDSTTGVFSDKHVGTGKTVTVGFTVAGADAGNYTVLANTTTTANITPREISGLIVADSKVYDATTAAVTSGSLSGVLGSDELLIDSTTGVFSDKHVGSSKTVTVGFTVAGADAGNYTVLANTTTTANITPREISGLIVADSKVYDATTAAVTSGSLSGVLGSDDLYIDATTGSFSDKHVGSSKTVTAGFTVAGADAGNYTVQANTEALADITPREITGLIIADDKVYDGTTVATTSGSLIGVLGADDIRFDAISGSFSSKNAGSSKTVSLSYSLAGSDAGNYLVVANATTRATISKLAITGSLVALDKIYDAYTGATVQRTLNGVLAGDSVTLSARGVFADKNVGTDKTVTFSQVRLLGTDAGNYTVSTNSSDTADIFIRDITASIFADSKVYDGTTTADTYADLENLIDGEGGNPDDIYLTTTGQFTDRHAGDVKTVLVSGTLGGADMANYRLVSVNSETTADIYARDLSVVGSSVADKVYDGQLTAQVNVGALVGVLAGDQVAIDSASALFADRHVGNGKEVTATYNLTGASAGDYYAFDDTLLTGNITPKTLTISGSSATSKVYDGGVAAAVVAGRLQGVIAGDTVQVGAVGAFDSRHVGTGKAVATTYTLSGGEGGNYQLAGETLTADITPRTLTITGTTARDKVYDATVAAPVQTGVLSGKLAGDDVTAQAVGVFADKNVGSDKPVTVRYDLAGTDAGNYALSGQVLSADITPATLVIHANDATRAAGAADPGFSININNFLIGDNVSGLSGATFFNADASTSLGDYVSGLTGSLSFSTTATPASGPGLYAIVPGGLLAANYTIDFQPGVLTVTEAAQAGGEDGGIPFVNNPQDLPDPEDFENPVIVPPQDDDAPILGENGLLVVVGDGIHLPDGLSVDDDDDDENTF